MVRLSGASGFVGRAVSTFWIDTDRAWRATSSWVERADAWFRTQYDLEADFAQLQLGGASPSAVHSRAPERPEYV